MAQVAFEVPATNRHLLINFFLTEKSSPPSEAAVSVLNADSIASQNVADSSINIFGHQGFNLSTKLTQLYA